MLEGASPMHLTKSVDYAVIMEGEVEMQLDDGSCTILRQGARFYFHSVVHNLDN